MLFYWVIIALLLLIIILILFIIKNYFSIIWFFKMIILFIKNLLNDIYTRFFLKFLYLIYYNILTNIFNFETPESIKNFEEKYFSLDFFKYLCFNFSLVLFIIIFIYLLSLTIWTRAAGPRTRVDQLIAFTFKNIIPCIIFILIIIALFY